MNMCALGSRSITLAFLFISLYGTGQKQASKNIPADSSHARTVKPYNTIVSEKTITSTGLFKVHLADKKFYFEIPDSLLERDILVTNRISKAPPITAAGRIGYSGDLINEGVIRFSKGPDSNIFIKKIYFRESAKDSSKNGVLQSFVNSNFPPIIAAFNIKAYSPDSAGYLIDVSDYFKGDDDLISFAQGFKKFYALAGLQADKSYIESIHAFPFNIEIKSLKTYAQTLGAVVSYEINNSMILLPKYPMQPRYRDARIGYFADNILDYDVEPQKVKDIEIIDRWRLEPKKEDEEKYRQGVLIEPVKPIVFYIDPATPAKWVPYLIQGVNDWQKAFEKAGFKNAIYALPAPTDDSSWSLDDARHNVIIYKASPIENAGGPQIHDPRSGEILESHVDWYHNVLKLLHDWYFIQAGAIDPRARAIEYDDSLMGKLIRFVSSHEIGHTLGLRHNFGASSTVPVDSLRSKKWLEANGHTPSIMDYARFNYVAQPEDSISENGIFPRIGPYDLWAIEWGYRRFPPFRTMREEKTYLNHWVLQRLEKDPLLYLGYEDDADNPRAQSEDLGDDAMKASYYGILNLKRISLHLLEWTKAPAETYEYSNEMYGKIVNQYKRYIFHVVKNIGGIIQKDITVEQAGPFKDFTDKPTQQRAVKFLQEQLFTNPQWLLDLSKKMFSLRGGLYLTPATVIQKEVLEKILAHSLFSKLERFEADRPLQAYTIDQLLNDLEAGIWTELNSHKQINISRRELQKIYVQRLSEIVNYRKYGSQLDGSLYGPENDITDVQSILKGHINGLVTQIGSALPFCKDSMTRLHLLDVKSRLKTILKDKREE
jgi:hypothetical protein